MSDWIRNQKSIFIKEDLGPRQLAWLGDAVWELHQRLKLCNQAGRAKDLHLAVVSEVKAIAQAKALLSLEPFLSESEKNIVRRGRNSAGRGPRNGDPSTYGKASGFETMIGWLFLTNPERLAKLLDQLEEADLESNGSGLK